MILIGAALVNNIVLTRLLGVCPLFGVSARIEGATAMALATSFVLVLASVLAYLIETYVLAPLGLGYLRLIGFLLMIAASVQVTEMIVRNSHPLLHQLLGLYLPLIASNCAVLGVALLNVQSTRSFMHALFFGLGAALGFSLVLIVFAGIRARIDVADVPEAFRGPAVALITAGLISLAFIGFSGMAGK